MFGTTTEYKRAAQSLRVLLLEVYANYLFTIKEEVQMNRGVARRDQRGTSTNDSTSSYIVRYVCRSGCLVSMSSCVVGGGM